MAAVKKAKKAPPKKMTRVSPIKPGLKGARNWATAQVRAASYSREGFWRLTLSVFLTFLFIVFGALWLGGFFPDVRKIGDDFTRGRLISMGFVVDRVDVMGEGRLREADVRTALGVHEGDFLFDMNIQEAQRRVEDLNWVDRAIVRRLWPDRVVVQIIERRPYALWQHDGNLKLVDLEGNVIANGDPIQFAGLPLIVGEGAPANMISIQTTLREFPAVNSRVDALIRLPSGRWDVRMNDGRVRLKLPKDNVSKALSKLMWLQSQSQILDRDVSVIDMRLPDRITFLPLQSEPV